MPISALLTRGLLLLPLLLVLWLPLAAGPVWAGALDDLEESAALDDVASGLAARGRGDQTGAIKRFTHALESGRLSPENRAVALNNRGNAHDDLGNSEQAVEDYSQAVKLVPGFAEAYYNRAFALFKLGRLDDALIDLDRVIALSPHLASAYFNRSFILLAKGLVARAISDVDKAVQLEPTNAKYRQHLAELQAAEAKHPPQEIKRAPQEGKPASPEGQRPPQPRND